jgi:hypothetical protein
MTFIFVNTGLSSRYFKSAQIRLLDSGAICHAVGEGPATVPRVIEDINPDWSRMFRIPRFCVVCGTPTWARRARNAFCTREQMSCARGIESGYCLLGL